MTALLTVICVVGTAVAAHHGIHDATKKTISGTTLSASSEHAHDGRLDVIGREDLLAELLFQGLGLLKVWKSEGTKLC